jgi:stage V sporulation protein G
MMDITKVTLRPVAMNKVCAIASVVIDDQFVIHDLRVVNGDKGLFVAMPSRKLPNGEFRDICHPINTGARNMIQDAVLTQFQLDGGLDAFSAAAEEMPVGAEMPATAYMPTGDEMSVSVDCWAASAAPPREPPFATLRR